MPSLTSLGRIYLILAWNIFHLKEPHHFPELLPCLSIYPVAIQDVGFGIILTRSSALALKVIDSMFAKTYIHHSSLLPATASLESSLTTYICSILDLQISVGEGR